jgi:hypothetical protein
MARRKLSMRGRVVAAGLSVGVAGVLVGSMAAGDHTASASHATTAPNSSDSATGVSGGSAQPYNPYSNDDLSSRDTGGAAAPSAPQPHTRSGGS